MTVRELIEVLEKFDGELEVKLHDSYVDGQCDVRHIEKRLDDAQTMKDCVEIS